MKIKPLILTAIGISLLMHWSAPRSRAELARFIQVVKVDDADTRFHLGELEAFENGVVPDDLGGAEHTQEAQFESKATSTNDIGGADGEFLTTYGDGAEFPEIGTTGDLEHGGANKDPNDALESGGAVWSTANGLGDVSAQYTLDLGEQYDVTTLRLFPRNDACCAARWENLEINLYQDDGGKPGKLSATVKHTENEGNIALEFILPPGINTLEQGLLGYWSFNDLGTIGGTVSADAPTLDANNTAADKSDGTVLGEPDLVEGPAGDGDIAIKFDGVDDAVTTEGQILNDTASFTMSGWVKFEEQPGTRIGFFGQNDSVEFGMINPTTMQHWSAAGGGFDIPFGPVVEEWTNIVLVNSPTERILYVNGVEEARGGGSDPSNSSFPFNIGGAGVYDATGNYFTGEMDDIAVWDRQLTADEAAQIFETRAIIAPDFIDTDGDGMGDKFETANGLDPFDAGDKDTDLDGDTLSNFAEFELRTNPNAKDSDADGLDDNVETNTKTWVSASDTGTNPNNADSDKDGLSDGVETNTAAFVDASDTGTNPLVKDTDGDGATDGLEVSSGFDPIDPKSVASIQLKGGTFTVRHLHTSEGVAGRDGGLALIDGDAEADLGDITVQRAFINFVDNAAAAFVDSIEPYPLWGIDGNSEGSAFPGLGDLGQGPDHNAFAIDVTGSFFIQSPGGMVTFGVNSDDGFVLWIDGEEVGEAGDRGRGNTLMTVELTSGQHDLRLVQWENGGGAGGNMFISRGFGEVTTFTEGDFELLNAFNIAESPLEGDDSDSDDMADLWETFYFGDLSHVGTEDGDGDGLADLGEYANKANPTVKDSDGDGLEDGPEVNTYSTSPSQVDSDGDSLTDGAEVAAGTDPAKADTDGDSFADNVEKALGTSATDPNDKPVAVTQVTDGAWNEPGTWSSNAAPAGGNDYVAVGTVTSKLTSADGAFGGDSLTLVGPDLALDLAHSGDATVNLTLNNAVVNSTTANSLDGTLELKGNVSFNAGDNTLSLASPLTGAAILTFQGGTADSAAGNFELTGEGNHASLLNISGTDVAGFAAGSLGTGSITLSNGGVAFGYEYNNPTALIKIQGAEFRMVFVANVTVADVVGIDTDGNQLFSLFELLGGPGPYAAGDILAAFGLDEGVSGDGMLTLAGNTGDTDIDGLQDAWETANFGNLDAGPAGDPDGDGLINLAEEAGNTDPNMNDAPGGGGDPAPDPVGGAGDIGNVVKAGRGAISFGFPAGARFNVEYSTDLTGWTEIATGLTGNYEDADAGRNGGNVGFYRAVAQP